MTALVDVFGSDIQVIHLWEPTSTCTICDTTISLEWYLPMWCGMIIPDDLLDKIDWGGMPVCERCYNDPPPERIMKNQFIP